MRGKIKSVIVASEGGFLLRRSGMRQKLHIKGGNEGCVAYELREGKLEHEQKERTNGL